MWGRHLKLCFHGLELGAVKVVFLDLMNDLAFEYSCLDWADLEITVQLWSCPRESKVDQTKTCVGIQWQCKHGMRLLNYKTKERFDNQQVSINISKDHYVSPNHLPSALPTSGDQRRKTGNQDNLMRNWTREGSRVHPFDQTILTSMPRQNLTCFVYARQSSIHQRSTKKNKDINKATIDFRFQVQTWEKMHMWPSIWPSWQEGYRCRWCCGRRAHLGPHR